FPIQPAFTLTINKSQVQTIANLGIYLEAPIFFTHGQLYGTISCATTSSGVKIAQSRLKFKCSRQLFY
ncbi:hypothetical protein CROQUDRAFT_51975, partial [Cronartium quercuum f. sp. fusiforme G11]